MHVGSKCQLECSANDVRGLARSIIVSLVHASTHSNPCTRLRRSHFTEDDVYELDVELLSIDKQVY